MAVGSRITPRARRRMCQVLRWREQGRTLESIGRELKVTRERVRQIHKLALHLKASSRRA